MQLKNLSNKPTNYQQYESEIMTEDMQRNPIDPSDQNQCENGYLNLLPDTSESIAEETKHEFTAENEESDNEIDHTEKQISNEHSMYINGEPLYDSGYLEPKTDNDVGNLDGRYSNILQNNVEDNIVQTHSYHGKTNEKNINTLKKSDGGPIHASTHNTLNRGYVGPGAQNTLNGESGDYSYIHDSKVFAGHQLEDAPDNEAGYEYIPGDIGGFTVCGGSNHATNSNRCLPSATRNSNEEDSTYQPMRRDRKTVLSWFYQHKITCTLIFATLLTCVISTLIAMAVTMLLVKKEDVPKSTSMPVIQTSFPSTWTPTTSHNLTPTMKSTPMIEETTSKTTSSTTIVTEQPSTTSTAYTPPLVQG